MNRMEFWTPDMISFMKDAALKTEYFKVLARRVRALCPDAATVFDAGCGTGELSLQLSNLFENVIGADRSKDAIDSLRREAILRNRDNIRAVNCDLLKDSPESVAGSLKPDVMVFSFFGRVSQAFEIARRFGCQKAVIVKRAYTFHRFSLTGVPIDNDISFRKELESLTGSYQEEEFEVEFGQPFRSVEDALRFFEIYSRDTDRSVLTMQNIEKLLERTGDSEFPFYLRKNRKCILILANTGGK